ncbi:MAG: 2-oxoacid:acceptor oxidoreductase family protein [Bacillota bacterium]
MSRVDKLDLYLIGVGGQGIGLLSEVLIRAADYAGYAVKGVDTHGLAQRGGMVVSNLRLGESAHSPLIRKQKADIVIGMERNEAIRGMASHLKEEGELIYYDTSWQTLATRLGREPDVTTENIKELAAKHNIKVSRVYLEDLEDARMQNTVILANMAKEEKIPGVTEENYRQAMRDLMKGSMLEANLELFDSILE